MPATVTIRFDKKTRNAVCDTAKGMPSLGEWLSRIEALDVPLLSEAISGIWCGKEGRVALEIRGAKSMLCMGWYRGKVEWSYLS